MANLLPVAENWNKGRPNGKPLNARNSPVKTGGPLLAATSVFCESGELKIQNDKSILSVVAERPVDTYRVKFTSPLETVSGVRLEVLPHKSMTGGGLSRAKSSNFVLTDFKVNLLRVNRADLPKSVEVLFSLADFEQGVHLVSKAIDDDPNSGWAVFKRPGYGPSLAKPSLPL